MKITSANFLTSSPDLERCPESELQEFAFIGRSNVGKSSLINLLAGRKDLAKVSSTPGATRLINFFVMNQGWMLVDLPGYGYAKVKKDSRQQFQRAVSDYLAQREQLSCVFVLVDSRLTPQAIDLDFCDWLAVGGIPFVLIFTKTDKSKAGKVKANVEKFLEALSERVEGEPRYFMSSTKTGKGRGEILDFVDQVLKA
ncbi:ribosome biogenesis GTP-binding protein YihA/YsxC [Haloferula sp.]|uniref:ribosome biogenesis GTP-binding protein YihA/YsxC n=1 Tax=Haloferula sp. TaxID=2497595 RepID=UPI00329C4055